MSLGCARKHHGPVQARDAASQPLPLCDGWQEQHSTCWDSAQHGTRGRFTSDNFTAFSLCLHFPVVFQVHFVTPCKHYVSVLMVTRRSTMSAQHRPADSPALFSALRTRVRALQEGRWGFPGTGPGGQLSPVLPLPRNMRGGKPAAALHSIYPCLLMQSRS